MKKPQILTQRDYYRPFEYDKAFEFFTTQQQAFWVWSEVSLSRDVNDWQSKLTEGERQVIGNILKSFVQSEVIIGDYWRRIASIFPKPEIAMMATAFSNMETIHITAYAYLNETLGLTDFKGFLEDPVVMKRLGRLMSLPPMDRAPYEDDYEWRKKVAISLASFSAFGEGVSLFSAFAILLSFSFRNKMKGLGEIIEFSIRDESLHSNGGCWLFNQYMKENKDLHGIKREIYQAAQDTVAIEELFIDSVFQDYSIESVDKEDLKTYIKHRTNNKLVQIGLKPKWRDIDGGAIKRLEWFDYASAGQKHADFFEGRNTEYSRGVGDDDWEDIF